MSQSASATHLVCDGSNTVAAVAPLPLRPVASTPAAPSQSSLYPGGEMTPADATCKSSNDHYPLSKSAPGSPMVVARPGSEGTSAVSTTTAAKDDGNRHRHPGTHQSESNLRPQSQRSVPSIMIDDAGSRLSSRPSSRKSERKRGGLRRKKSGYSDNSSNNSQFTHPPPATSHSQGDGKPNGIDVDVGETQSALKFSNHGSLLERRPPRTPQKDAESDAACIGGGNSLRVRRTSQQPSRAISADEDMLSRRVRLMYEKGNEDVSDTEVAKAMALENGVLWEENATAPKLSTDGDVSFGETETKSLASTISRYNFNNAPSITKEAYELAGGIEYWQNIGAGDVDRYGFIRQRSEESNDPADRNPLQRVSTSLFIASQTPRRKHSIRPPTALSGNRSFGGLSPTRNNNNNYNRSSSNNTNIASVSPMRPTSSQSGYSPPLRRTSRFRHAANHLPHNRNRRFKDEAGDMLTLPSDMTKGRETRETPSTRAMRKREWRREDKWMKMAKPMKKNGAGGGTTFEFDTHSSKLVERTWKGIPDRWRATAWYSFLSASAKRHPDSPPEEELIEAFHEFQYISSPDDVQIDIDVPRTITSHIMFRRRYRGGQRLLFRVLHAMSLYFPDTGYVQGMAALTATLLAYYDEEHAFIMLVRLWQLRGLGQLYKSGFAGLMEALEDFEREWLEKGEVAAKLNELGVPPTSYGTRWYLTLFNYSIPFPAQLRVWDVFMLLGDAEGPPTTTSRSHGKFSSRSAPSTPTTATPTTTTPRPPSTTSSFGKGLDVIHATSAALIDGMREIILDSDFENSMKVLTSWVPIKDVELFMRVAKAEWKVHSHRKKSG